MVYAAMEIRRIKYYCREFMRYKIQPGVENVKLKLRRNYSSLLIPGLALLAVIVMSEVITWSLTTDKTKVIAKDPKLEIPKPLQTATNGKSKHKLIPNRKINRLIRINHYISDRITDFVINATPCPGSGNKIARRQKRKVDIPFEGSDKSKHSNDHYDALFLVCSHLEKKENRRIFRQFYGNHTATWPYRIKVVFLIGRPANTNYYFDIYQEARKYGDIVMGNFMEYYYNLTYKTVMAYRWLSTHCTNIELVLKVDDDVALDVYKFMDVFLPLMKTQIKTINGYVNRHARVYRRGKYGVTYEEQESDSYPEFCSGFFIVTSPDIVNSIYPLTKTVQFFPLEDVFTYGFVREKMRDVQISPMNIVTVDSVSFIECIGRYKYKCKYIASEVPAKNLLAILEKITLDREMYWNATANGVVDVM